jgi:hypothetical protein
MRAAGFCIGRPCITMKSVPKSRNGSNEPRGPRPVSQRRADFRHQVVQTGFRDKRL